MFQNPIKELFKTVCPRGNFEYDLNQLILRIIQFNLVQRQKYQHGMGTDPLIPIYESVIFNQPESQPGRFLLDRRISFNASKALKRGV